MKTCGEAGGLNARGRPCGRRVADGGRCRAHDGQHLVPVVSSAELFNPEWLHPTASELRAKYEGVDDLVGHVLEQEEWVHLNLPAIAEANERIQIGPGRFHARQPEDLLHPAHEPMEALERQRTVNGSYFFSAQCRARSTARG